MINLSVVGADGVGADGDRNRGRSAGRGVLGIAHAAQADILREEPDLSEISAPFRRVAEERASRRALT